MLTHKNFFANYRGIAQLNAVRPDDNMLAILPLHHAFPFTATLLLPLFSRAKITYLDTLKAEAILRCIKEQQVTILVLTPQVLQHFYQGMQRQLARIPWPLRPLLLAYLKFSRRVSQFLGVNPAGPLHRKFRGALGEQFRFFVSGGAKLPESLAENLARLGFTVLEGYGLTETAPVVTFNPPGAPRLGSAGRPLAGVEVRILDPGADGVGEVLIRGDNVMAGYFQNEAATREVIKDGWFHSGDLGYLDGDGYLYLRGRIKDIIVLASGKNVSAEEVGQHYLQAPAIKEIFVTTDSRAEKLVAVVVPDLDFFRKAGEADIYAKVKWDLELLSQGLEPYKRVRDFVLVNEELPKTRLGKVKMHEAQRIYQEQAGKRRQPKKPITEAGLSPVGETVVAVLARHLEDSRISLDDHLELDLGLDSLGLVELLAALESRFNLKIGDGEFIGIFTVRDLIGFIEAKKPEASRELEREPAAWGRVLMTEPDAALLRRLGMGGGLTARLATQGLAAIMGSSVYLDVRPQGVRPGGSGGPGVHPVPQPRQLPGRLPAGLCGPRAAAPPPVFFGIQRVFRRPGHPEPYEAYPGHPGGLGPKCGGGPADVGLYPQAGPGPGHFSRRLPHPHRGGGPIQEGRGHPGQGTGGEAGPGLHSRLFCRLASRGEPAPLPSHPGILRPGIFLAGTEGAGAEG